MISYRRRLDALVDELRSNPHVTVLRAEVRPPATAQSLETARTYASYALPPGVEDFYTEVDGCAIAWQQEGGGDRAEGSMDVVPVARVFGNWRGTTWFDDFAGGDQFRDVKPFDVFVSEACGAFLQEPDAAPGGQVVLHSFGEGTSAMGLSFPEYLDRMVATRGLLYWQRAFVGGGFGAGEAAAFSQRLSSLFATFSYDDFARPGAG